MTDREEVRKKVIEGLERCDLYGYCADKQCPYYENVTCHEALRRDTLSLLEEQEPRVMTLEEVQKISTEDLDGVVWLESRMYSDPDNGDCNIWFSGWANPVESCEMDIHIYAFGNEVPVEAKKRMYGITWRCWTSRPTDEQREATPWN